MIHCELSIHSLLVCVVLGASDHYTAKTDIDVKAIDEQVCEVLKQPSKSPSEERKLMKNLQLYYEYLDNINDRIDRKWREAENVKRLLDKIGKEGPKMINSAVNAEDFKKAYEWDDDDVDTMTTTILGIKYMWDQVTRRTKYLTSSE